MRAWDAHLGRNAVRSITWSTVRGAGPGGAINAYRTAWQQAVSARR